MKYDVTPSHFDNEPLKLPGELHTHAPREKDHTCIHIALRVTKLLPWVVQDVHCTDLFGW